MTEKSWRVWFETIHGATDIAKVFHSERRAEDYAAWLGARKHIAKAYVVESEIELHPTAEMRKETNEKKTR